MKQVFYQYLGSQPRGILIDVFTLSTCYLQGRDHKHEVFHHLLELYLESLRVFNVSQVLLHQHVSKIRRHHLVQRDPEKMGEENFSTRKQYPQLKREGSGMGEGKGAMNKLESDPIPKKKYTPLFAQAALGIGR